MNIIPDNLSALQRHLLSRVEFVAAESNRPALEVLYRDFGSVLPLDDLAALAAAITGQPTTVEDAHAALTGESSLRLPALPVCGRLAVHRVEVYSPVPGQAYGSLDASLYACETHRADMETALDAAGLTTHRMPVHGAPAQQCGSGYDFTTRRAIGGAR